MKCKYNRIYLPHYLESFHVLLMCTFEVRKKIMNKINIALGIVIVLLIASIAVMYSKLSQEEPPNYDYYLHQIDSLSHQIDTVEIEETKTVIRYKTKTINEIIYINTSNDTQQLAIRAGIRSEVDRSITE